jgi:hypothetical protein
VDKEYWYSQTPHPFCSALTYAEWNRLFAKDEQEAIDLSSRLMAREVRLELGHDRRIPKHRFNKKGRHLP